MRHFIDPRTVSRNGSRGSDRFPRDHDAGGSYDPGREACNVFRAPAESRESDFRVLNFKSGLGQIAAQVLDAVHELRKLRQPAKSIDNAQASVCETMYECSAVAPHQHGAPARSKHTRGLEREDLQSLRALLIEELATREFIESVKSENASIKRLITDSRRTLSGYERTIAATKKRLSLIGKPSYPLDVEAWVNGQLLSDGDLEGKVVLLDFWAVWCGPCIATFPHLREWRERYSDKGLVIIGMTRYYNYDWDEKSNRPKRVDTKEKAFTPQDEQAAMVKFAEHHKLKHPFAVMPRSSKFSSNYGVTGIPQVVVIDRKGTVRLIRVGSGEQNARDVEEMIQNLLESTDAAAGQQ